MLLFATGGPALTDIRVAGSYSDNCAVACAPRGNITGSSTSNKTVTGLAVGGGIEWAIDRNWTFKGEYLHACFGHVATTYTISETVVGGVSPNTIRSSTDQNANIARFGINYKF